MIEHYWNLHLHLWLCDINVAKHVSIIVIELNLRMDLNLAKNCDLILTCSLKMSEILFILVHHFPC